MPTHFSTRTALFVLFCQCIVYVWGSASLVPPSTFPPPSATGTSASLATSTGITSITITTTALTGTGTTNATTSAASSSTQFPSLSGVSSCVSDCLANAIARVNCTSVVDVNCFCFQPHFPNELVACILADCADQVATAEMLAQQFCNVAATTTMLTFEPVPTTTTTSSTPTSALSTSPVPSSTTSQSSAGRHKVITWGLFLATFGSLLGL